MKLFLRYCQKELLFRTLDSGPRCVCSKIADFHFCRALHSRGELSKSSAILTERTNLSSKYETKSVPQLEKLNFDDPKQAYRSKTTWEIARALLVLKLCSINVLVERNMQIMKLSKKLLGKRLFNYLMKLSIYGHFVAGEDQESIKPTIQNMEAFGVGSILDYSVEEDISEDKVQDSFSDKSETSPDTADEHARFQPHSEFADRRVHLYSARTYFYEGESECDRKMETFLNCIDAAGYASKDGFAAIKLTALGRPQILMRVSQILSQTQHFFDQLAADTLVRNQIGHSVARNKFFEGLKRLGTTDSNNFHIKVEMSSDEAERIFDLIDTDKSGCIDVIEWHEFLTPQLQLSKLFKAKPEGDERGRPIISVLTDQELGEFDNMRKRLETLAYRAEEKGVRLMVDAEQSYFQPAIRRLTLDVQRSFNKTRPLIFNTYQCYLKAAYVDVETDMELARREGFMFGAKLVRGAYMEQERERATSLGYNDPVHPSYEATSRCYNEVMNAILEETKRGRSNVMVASHNEESVWFAVQRMHELGLDPKDRKVFFGQLLGMCDQISFTLGQRNYAVYKYVPYGPVEEVLPYLSRRAMENRGFLKGVLKERKMLFSELRRRIQNKEFFSKPSLNSPQ